MNNDDSSSSSSYSHEYEIETITIKNNTTCTSTSSSSSLSFDVLSVLPPPIEYLSELSSRDTEISGMKVWCGSLLLCHYLLHHCQNILTTAKKKKKKKNNVTTILELGSGTGIVGMLLASKITTSSSTTTTTTTMSGSCVVLTDGDEEVLSLLQKNLIGNGINDDIAKACLLRWTRDDDDDEEETNDSISFSSWCRDQFPSSFENNNNKNNNNNSDDNNVTFDLIVAGDVIYKHSLLYKFFETVRRYLSLDDGKFYLCHVPRAGVDHEDVMRVAEEVGFQMREEVVGEEILEGLVGGGDVEEEDLRRAKVYSAVRRR